MKGFIDSLPKLPTPAQMREWDKAAVEFGLPESLLMENAGQAIYDFLAGEFTDIGRHNAAIFMGKGNNGGDAACVARHLVDAGANVVIFYVGELESRAAASAWEVDLARADGLVFEPIATGPDGSLPENYFLSRFLSLAGKLPDILIDGLLGTGFANELKPDMRSIIMAVNWLKECRRAFTAAIDIPSGLNGLTGKPSPIAIKADATITLAAAKPGLLQAGAREWTGKIHERGIGMPRAIASVCPASWRLIDGRCLLRPRKAIPESYKNIYGHVLVIGGAKGLSGAAHMAAASALRAGAGLVTACSPGHACDEIKNGWPEIMTHALGGRISWPDKLEKSFCALIEHASALVIGPGMGRGADAVEFLRLILEIPDRPPAVIDADALTILGEHRDMLKLVGKGDILTPHPGEAGSLLGCSAKDAQADRLATLNGLLEITKAVVVLKGAFTLVSRNNREILLAPYDVPQLAIGGAGDVLSGIIGALAGAKSSEMDALACAAKGVAIHLVAGMILAEKYPHRGGRCAELADAVAHVEQYLADLPKNELNAGELPWPNFS